MIRERPAQFDPARLPADWHPLVKRIYAARLASPDEYDKRLASLAAPHDMADLDQAVARIRQALDNQQRILIFGDYDVDGACSTALMVRVLRRLGGRVDWFIPDRKAHGYGLSVAGLNALPSLPDLLITVDNGIQSFEAAEWLAAHEVDLIITDHHLPGEAFPVACAVVNPQREDCGFGERSLCGAGVALYVLFALRRSLVNDGQWPDGLNLTDYFDLVALATIADLVPLSRNNRILVHYGLQRLRSRQGNPGLLALAAVANVQAAHLTAQDIAFAIAPRLNAAGRLGDMRDGVALLLSDDWQTAHDFAADFDALNRARKTLENDILHDALSMVDTTRAIASAYRPDWHEGVIGIVAGRLKAQLNRPALIATLSEDGAWIKASMRSVAGINVKALLDEAATILPAGTLKHGGHAMAAGFSVQPDAYPALLLALEKAYSNQVTAIPQQFHYIDGELAPDLLNVQWANYLEHLEPWGQQLPAPTFCNVFDIINCRCLGANHSRLTLREPGSGRVLQAMWFFHNVDYAPGTRVRAVYALQVSRFHGDERLNLLIEEIEIANGSPY
ncbi:single-stranded-DNA-specific exonuclease RecJ [Cardiobacteriaceae bacterium TAE3-ERU3]|nr:single-stranded-DNA-specific exonuclease RecJ [Cardiobacteriaceae bacterium TAE3-ERU3]